MKTVIGALIFIFFTTYSFAQSRKNISIEFFKNLVGSWKSSLTYMDYSSGKPYNMDANLDVSRIVNTNFIIYLPIF